MNPWVAVLYNPEWLRRSDPKNGLGSYVDPKVAQLPESCRGRLAAHWKLEMAFTPCSQPGSSKLFAQDLPCHKRSQPSTVEMNLRRPTHLHEVRRLCCWPASPSFRLRLQLHPSRHTSGPRSSELFRISTEPCEGSEASGPPHRNPKPAEMRHKTSCDRPQS